MNEFKKNLLKLFLDHPFDYNLYLDGYKNKDYAFRVIKSFIPTDTGIEWEIGECMVGKLLANHRSYWWNRLNRESSFEVTYRVNSKHLNVHLLQLQRMYKFMSKPYYANIRQAESGIHIHTNLIHGMDKSIQLKLIRDPSRTTKKAVTMIAEEFFMYGGTYNELKFDWSKGNAIIYRREYETIEYRCINMTWDFRELLKYIIMCHLMTNIFLQYGSNKLTSEEFLDKVHDYILSIHQL